MLVLCTSTLQRLYILCLRNTNRVVWLNVIEIYSRESNLPIFFIVFEIFRNRIIHPNNVASLNFLANIHLWLNYRQYICVCVIYIYTYIIRFIFFRHVNYGVKFAVRCRIKINVLGKRRLEIEFCVRELW